MALSNNYLDCEVLNLDPDDPRHIDQAGLANFLQRVRASGGMLSHIRQNIVRYKIQKQL